MLNIKYILLSTIMLFLSGSLLAQRENKYIRRGNSDFEEKNPTFALAAGMAALYWLVQGYGYDITSAHVHAAHDHTMKAAENAGCVEETRERVRTLVSKESQGDRFVSRILGTKLGLS